MKFNFSKGAVFAYVLLFGVAGLVAVLRKAGLNDVADFLEQNIGVIDQLSSSQIVALVLALLGLHQSKPAVETK